MQKFLAIVCSWLFVSSALPKPPSRIEVPAQRLAVIKKHLVQIEQKGWGRLEPGELYHGHLIMTAKRGSESRFRSVNELFDNSALMLYHSDEQLRRWLGIEGDIPWKLRTPRSIVGYWDGRVVPAASLVKDSEKAMHFVSSGSIHSDELAHDMPEKLAFWKYRGIELPRSEPCRVNLIVDISVVHDQRNKPNLFIGDRRFMVTLDCVKTD